MFEKNKKSKIKIKMKMKIKIKIKIVGDLVSFAPLGQLLLGEAWSAWHC